MINSTEIDYIKTGVQNYNTDDNITDIKMNLLYCYPNPFNSSLGIKFILPVPSKVQLIIFNNIGQCISRLEYPELQQGEHNLSYDFSFLSSGIYLIYLKTDQSVQKRLVTFIK